MKIFIRRLPVIDRLCHPLNPTGVIRWINCNELLCQALEQLDMVFELMQLGVEGLQNRKRSHMVRALHKLIQGNYKPFAPSAGHPKCLQ